ncbi:MrcB family domain-containing protein [Thiomicrorhabdus sp.]|uniref:MrcB family domain-containing protein n=1 Tax=Thiomicrorhabdus sp. TaxID=2039724 RepID=UPI002AA66DF2|nr:DUF3578 domain-containing protein [Thiomicrorhabdus sp.]
MPNISDSITKDDVLQAVDKIDSENLQGQSQKYEVVINGKHYPPPLVCQYADYFAKGEQGLLETNTFPVGQNTRCFKTLEGLGFDIVEKHTSDFNVKALLDDITQNWVESTQEGFANHPIRQTFERLKFEIEQVLDSDTGNEYKIKASIGAGNWASVPWVSILDTSVTTSTQDGIYPVYLFCADGSGVYLSLGLGTTALTQQFGNAGARREALKIRNLLREQLPGLSGWDTDINLNATTPLGNTYEWGSAGAKFYASSAIPENSQLKTDLLELMNIYNQSKSVNIGDESLVSDSTELNNLTYHRLSKPFLLLAGLSGTGKTRFVREQAEKTGSLESTYCLVSVRPDWHEPSDLLGYVSRLGQDGAEFITTDVLRFMVKAWLSVIDLPNSFSASDSASEFDYTTHDISKIPPFWLCLDEMNLAPVEQYFADYLSVIETRKWEEGVYTCDPLLKPDTFKQLEPKGLEKLREALGLKEPVFDGLWRYFVNKGIGIPFNLIVAGTVNMDETTHGFSRKVIDRALTFDFGEFFPNNSAAFFEAVHEPKALGYPLVSHAKLVDLSDVIIDSDGQKTRAFFDAVNHVLKGTMFELAYRALNELFVSVISFKPKTDLELQAVWDDFLMMKVLPRIEGDEDKLSVQNSDLLNTLIETFKKPDCLQSIWEGLTRPDLFRETIKSPESPIFIACRARLKLEWMQDRLKQNGFTSFWP